MPALSPLPPFMAGSVPDLPNISPVAWAGTVAGLLLLILGLAFAHRSSIYQNIVDLSNDDKERAYQSGRDELSKAHANYVTAKQRSVEAFIASDQASSSDESRRALIMAFMAEKCAKRRLDAGVHVVVLVPVVQDRNRPFAHSSSAKIPFFACAM